jgi:CheY-like chemotaxis protein
MHSFGKHQPVRVLVVEDDWLIREMLADVLEEAGFVTTLAFSVTEALRRLQQDERFDLVVTDVELPGVLDGVDLARLLAVQRPKIGVLIVSGRCPRPIPAAAQFLAKPFTSVELLHALGKLAQEPRVSTAS